MNTITADRELAFAGPAALAELVHAREATPRELVELYLRRIEALDPNLNAFRVTLAEQALAEADALDGDRLAGPLAGVPIAVKDDIAVRRSGRDEGHARLRRWPARGGRC